MSKSTGKIISIFNDRAETAEWKIANIYHEVKKLNEVIGGNIDS